MRTRRDFLRHVGAGALLAPLGCAGLPIVDASTADSDRVVLGLHATSAEDAVALTLERVDMSWLVPGDSVFVKVACNSGNTHPAVTSPSAVRAMCRALFDRGAGRVMVGDQSGVMSVRLAAGERRHSSTRILMEGNGLLRAIEESGAEARFFDDDGFDAGYVEATMPALSSWRTPPMIARAITEVDHVVYLPRLASHVLTGYTHGHKLAVGWLRDDARHAMHFEAADLYEKYTEVNYCEQLRSRLRLVVTVAEQVLVEGGPDSGTRAIAETPIVLASAHLANHDAVSVALLWWAQRHLPRAGGNAAVPFGPWAPMGNAALLALVEPQTGIPWTSKSGLPSTYFAHDYAAGVTSDRALSRAYEILGGVPRGIEVELVGAAPQASLMDKLARMT